MPTLSRSLVQERAAHPLAASLAVLVCVASLEPPPAAAQTAGPPPADHQIAAAVLPLPASLREGAEVRGYRAAGGEPTVLRRGSNDMICLADPPGDERFHVACYHASLEPFMARGRELRAEGVEREAADSIRLAEADARTLPMPERAAALYSLTATTADWDAATSTLRNAQPLYVLYTPWATPEELGVPTESAPGRPWVMYPGKASSHIMIVPPKQDVGEGAER